MLPAAVKTVCRGYEQRTHIGWKENALPLQCQQACSAGTGILPIGSSYTNLRLPAGQGDIKVLVKSVQGNA